MPHNNRSMGEKWVGPNWALFIHIEREKDS